MSSDPDHLSEPSVSSDFDHESNGSKSSNELERLEKSISRIEELVDFEPISSKLFSSKRSSTRTFPRRRSSNLSELDYSGNRRTSFENFLDDDSIATLESQEIFDPPSHEIHSISENSTVVVPKNEIFRSLRARKLDLANSVSVNPTPHSLEIHDDVSKISKKLSDSKNISKFPYGWILLLSVLLLLLISVGIYFIFTYTLILQRLPFNAFFRTRKQLVSVTFPSNIHKLNDVSHVVNKEKDLIFFWYIPYAADLEILKIFGQCYSLSQASDYEEKVYNEYMPLQLVNLGGMAFMNVNLFSHHDIMRAANLGLFESHQVDLFVSPHLELITKTLKRESQMHSFLLLRHPIEHAIDRYYNLYSQRNLTQISIFNFTKQSLENNWLTRQLINNHFSEMLTDEHIEVAKEILRRKFIIGLIDEISESFQRFKIYFGWSTEMDISCENYFINRIYPLKRFQDYTLTNSELKQIFDSNYADLSLYKYAQSLFQEQGKYLF